MLICHRGRPQNGRGGFRERARYEATVHAEKTSGDVARTDGVKWSLRRRQITCA